MSPTSRLQPVSVPLLSGYGFIAFTKAPESETEPKTPPCILIILIAAWWFPKSVAPQQSDSSKHSKPRSFASLIVVCTQTSVVIPVNTRF